MILFEDDHLLALDKPAGVVVHPTYRHAAGTLMNALLWHARAWPAGSRPSLVGRLDKLTSGIVVVAKTAAVHAALQREMASSRSEKDYLAVVYGRVNAARGEIALRLGHDSSDRAENRGVGSRRRAERDAVLQGSRGPAGCHSSDAGSSPGARIRFASTWPRAAGRSSAIPCT